MESTSKWGKMVPWICAVIIGVLLLVVYEVKSAKCTEPVTAYVDRVTSRRKSYKSGKRRRYKTVYKGHFTYSFGNKSYKGTTPETSSSYGISQGSAVHIMVNPDKPSMYVIPSDNSKEFSAFIFIGLGIIGGLVTAYKEFDIFSSSKKKDDDFYY